MCGRGVVPPNGWISGGLGGLPDGVQMTCKWELDVGAVRARDVQSIVWRRFPCVLGTPNRQILTITGGDFRFLELLVRVETGLQTLPIKKPLSKWRGADSTLVYRRASEQE